jgi:uncharacterized Fe-S cluster-containing radical SAM superfamily enzyme
MKEILPKIESINNTEAQLMSILGEIMQMGANDSEYNQIMDLVRKVKEGKIEQSVAISEAEKIKNSKQAYH